MDINDFESIKDKKTVIVGPEGCGKSTTILNLALTYGGKYVYCTHTKENASEKFNQFNQFSNISHIKSNSEIFTEMISYKDKTFGHFIGNCGNKSQPTKPVIDIWSRSKNGKLHHMRFNQSWCEENWDNNYSYRLNGELQKLFNSSAQKDYFIFYKFYNEFPKDEVEFEAVNFMLDGTSLRSGVNYFRINSESINWMKHTKKVRDEKIKEGLEANDVVFIAQNKTAEMYLIDKLDDTWTAIIDEVGLDAFRYMTVDELLQVESISTKIILRGYETLDYQDIQFLKDRGLESSMKKKSGIDFSLNKDMILKQLPADLCCVSQIRIGDISLAPRITKLNRTILLTSEQTVPILLNSYGFSTYNLEELVVKDNNLKICISNKNTKGKVITSKKNYKNEIVDFIEYKRKKNGIKNYMSIGTSSFGTDYNLQSCKGRNFHMTRGFKEIDFFKNPYSNMHFNKLLTIYITNNPHAEYEELKDIVKKYIIDELNQALGRFCGNRDINKAKKVLYLHETDQLTIEVLNELRYLGEIVDFDSLFNFYEMLDEVCKINTIEPQNIFNCIDYSTNRTTDYQMRC